MLDDDHYADKPQDDPIARGDLDDVLRLLDGLCDRRDWDGVERLRQRCLVAFERGHQLWPAAGAAAHRLALFGPPALAAQVCADPAPPFRIGPLTEVAASTHTWDELAPHLPHGPSRSAIAQERLVRGDDLGGEGIQDPILGLPLVVAPWEPLYPLATYSDHGFEAPSPRRPELQRVALGNVAATAAQAVDDVTDALRALVATWVDHSTGRAETSAVQGSAEDAIAALGPSQVHAADVDVATFVAAAAWAAASGGAQGPRRGLAAARLDVWWLLACATNLNAEWPVEAEDLTEALDTVRFVMWHPGHQPSGWELHIAIEDRLDGLAWSLAASDAA